MRKNAIFTKILAIVGTALVWIPVLAPVVFACAALSRMGRFLFDYLMPAELFPVVLVGGGLLLWVALRVHSHRKLIGWGLGGAVGLLVGSQGLAVVTGLASGRTAATGLWWIIVLGSIILYDLAVVAVGVGGILLLRELFKRS
jgi:hypothetical protein